MSIPKAYDTVKNLKEGDKVIDIILYPILIGIIIYGIIMVRFVMNYQNKEVLNHLKKDTPPKSEEENTPSPAKVPATISQSTNRMDK